MAFLDWFKSKERLEKEKDVNLAKEVLYDKEMMSDPSSNLGTKEKLKLAKEYFNYTLRGSTKNNDSSDLNIVKDLCKSGDSETIDYFMESGKLKNPLKRKILSNASYETKEKYFKELTGTPNEIAKLNIHGVFAQDERFHSRLLQTDMSKGEFLVMSEVLNEKIFNLSTTEDDRKNAVNTLSLMADKLKESKFFIMGESISSRKNAKFKEDLTSSAQSIISQEKDGLFSGLADIKDALASNVSEDSNSETLVDESNLDLTSGELSEQKEPLLSDTPILESEEESVKLRQ
jgi:hypothetical protein